MASNNEMGGVAGMSQRVSIPGEPIVTQSAERYVMSGSRSPLLAIKEGDLFLYSDTLGQIRGGENTFLGMYYQDTRFLSRWELSLAGRQPVFLAATAEHGHEATIELTNLEGQDDDGRTVPQACVHVHRSRFLLDRLHERIQVRNYHHEEIEVALELTFDADFADFFEVRGLHRSKRGLKFPVVADDTSLTFSYLGLDEIVRKTVVTFADRPSSIREGTVRHVLRLAPREAVAIKYDIQIVEPHPPKLVEGGFREKLGMLRADHERWDAATTDIFTDNELVNKVLRRGKEDLRMLGASIGGHTIPLAGLPWFAAPFGREMLFAGLETLMLDLRWSQSAVAYLAERQGSGSSGFRGEQPGKIMHEQRRGELANLREIPHALYYASVDATPLWLLSLCESTMWTGDLDGFDFRRDEVDAALGWLERYGDLDGDGFVEYSQRSGTGISNQGWRDASDAILHRDGTLAEGPIALAETQGYVYYAKRRLAALYGELGDVERAERLAREAATLKRRFNEQFWMEDEGYFAMALDGEKRQVKSVCSTIGHALWARIIDDEHVPAVAKRLMAPDMFTGWGIRTLSKEMKGYNPVSFYNGGVWTADTAIIANGLKKHGYVQESNRLARCLVEAALTHEYTRLPELFCGFTRRMMSKPVSFPMACSPEIGAAGALFHILQSMVGVYAHADENVVYVHNPALPRWLNEVTLANLRVGRTTMRLRFRRKGSQTSLVVLDKEGPGRIVVVE